MAALVVLSYGFWRRRFGGDPRVIGRTLAQRGTLHHPRRPGEDFEPFRRRSLDAVPVPANTDQAHYFTAAARLKPGVTLAMANTQMQAAADRFRAASRRDRTEGQLRRATAAGAAWSATSGRRCSSWSAPSASSC